MNSCVLFSIFEQTKWSDVKTMRRLLLLGLALLATLMLTAQDFIGSITDNHVGVPMMNVQPASIASSPWKWDVHPLGANFSAINTNVFDAIGSALEGNPLPFIENTDEFLITANVLLPSFSLRINDRMAIGLEANLRAQFFTQSSDSELLGLVVNGFEDPDLIGLNFTDEFISGRGHLWWEIGGVFAYRFWEQGDHSLSGGLTLRYLGGMASGYIDASDLSFTYSDEEQLTEVNGTLQLVYNNNLNALTGEEERFKLFSDPGFGGSLGLEYLWAPDPEKYTLKLGAALLDWGSIRYSQSPFSNVYVADGIQVDVEELSEAEDLDALAEELGKTFEQVTQENDQFTFYTPMKLALQADYRIASSIYFLNFSAYIALRNNFREVGSAIYYSTYILTPRLEKPTWGIQVPVSYNELTGVTAGIGFRAGPVYLNAQNIIGAIANGKDAKSFSLALGFRFGGRY
jgi:hypothetical protein